MAAITQLLTCEAPIVERQTLCFPGVAPGDAIHAGEAEFRENLERNFVVAENNAAEGLVKLKAELRTLEFEAFWNRLMEGLAELCHAQFGFVSKRILVDDHDAAVEMPRIGEVGSCLLGVALYWNDGNDIKNMARDYKYYAWGAPCSYMRHDKVFLVAEDLNRYVTDNPNQLPFECEGYLGVPLFADGKCFAHFGLMWTKQGLELKKHLTWGYIEMVMHALEDMIAEKLLSGQGIAKVNNVPEKSAEITMAPQRVIPQESVTPSQSLKPYAKSLSHELRTPMHGVVGMLDVMYATVQEQIEGQASSKMLNVFKMLKDNIETVQDSSKRAVEAADNVVYAYDLNMQVPDTPSHEFGPASGGQGYFDSRPKMVEGSNIVNPFKRRRSSPAAWDLGNPTKVRHLDPDVRRNRSNTPQSPQTKFGDNMFPPAREPTPISTPVHDSDRFEFPRPSLVTPADMDVASTPGLRQCNVRDLIPVVINDALRVGGRPDSAVAEPLALGERIVVRTRSSNGHASQKIIEWTVQNDVPDIVAMDERDLSKLISAVFLNAIKFTENGNINIHTSLSTSKRYILITISDTGSGIPETFRPELFKAFAKEDHSITRNKEGLGLGLLVAKGLARRSGGDIVLIRSSTDGPDQGTEFEIRVPLDHDARVSQSGTPFASTPDRNFPRSTPKASIPVSTPTPKQCLVDEKTSSPLHRPVSPLRKNAPDMSSISKLISVAASEEKRTTLTRRPSATPTAGVRQPDSWDRNLAQKYPLKFLVAEDNKINRKLLVNMLGKLGYKNTYEAFDGREAVRIMEDLLAEPKNGAIRDPTISPVDVVLMDLWMPEMDGYEATEKIMAMFGTGAYGPVPIVLAVSADVTEQAVDRATKTGMQGYMTKPYKIIDLQRLIIEFCGKRTRA